MKCIRFDSPGDANELYVTETDKPEPSENEVLIKVYSFALNPIDIKTRKGKGLFGMLESKLPIIPGWDISGEVVKTGSHCEKFSVGDQVFGMINFPGYGKAYAEYVCASEKDLAIKPENIKHKEAAASSLAALTALQAFKLHQNQFRELKVLIHAAAGGVGHFAVQMALFFNSYIFGTCSAANFEFLKSIGVDKPVDYQNNEYDHISSDLDFVLDPIGGDTTMKSLEFIKEGGTLVSLVGGVTEEIEKRAKELKINAVNYRVSSSGEDMETIAKLLKDKTLRPFISHEYKMEEIENAHIQIESGKTRGKIVVNICE